MAKPYKIKRYNGRYHHRKSLLAKLVLVLVWLLGIIALVWVGFYAYQPIMDFIDDSMNNSSSSQNSESLQTSSQLVSSSMPSQSQEPVLPVYDGVTKAVFLSRELYSVSDTLEAFLASAVNEGANTVVVEYKDDEGIVYHDTNVAMAIEGKAVSENATDLSIIAKTIRDAGLIPAARIYGFEDHTVSYQLRDVAGHYRDEDFLWYDDSPENGGKAWLNPYNEEARAYLLELADEAAELGFEEIVMSGVHFPKGYQLDAINFGETAGVSKSQILRDFSVSLEEALESRGARLSMVVLASDITSPNGFTYGEESALDIFSCKVYLDLTETNAAEISTVISSILADRTGDYGAVLTDDDAFVSQTEALKQFDTDDWLLLHR